MNIFVWSNVLAAKLVGENGGPLGQSELAIALRNVARENYNKAIGRAVDELEDCMLPTAAAVVNSLPRQP